MMKSPLSVIAGLLLLAAPASPAAAQSVTLYQSGLWRTYSGRTSTGQALCALGTAFENKRQLYVKWFEGADNLVVQLFKSGWAIAPDASAPLVFRLDRSPPWRVRTVRLGRVTDFLEFPIGHDEVRAFTRDFTGSNTMAIEFPGGDEAAWTVSLQGNSAAMDALVRCIERLAGPDDLQQPYAYLLGGPQIGQGQIPSTQPVRPRPFDEGSSQARGGEGPAVVPQPFVEVPRATVPR